MRVRDFLAGLFASLVAACAGPAPRVESAPKPPPPAVVEQAVFAGGCFWCAEHDFDKLSGVVDVVSGYSGGQSENPTYENHAGHYEVVRVTFDPAVVSYRQLVDHYWRLVDPTDAGGQFCDRGDSYRTAIFATPAQMADAEASKAALIAAKTLKDPVVTPVLPAAPFTVAEDYHQDYAKKNPVRYNFYRNGCGRDARLKQVWGDK
jgi:peptide-methionine (S)-S-oxide reductase